MTESEIKKLRGTILLWFAGFGIRPDAFDDAECQDQLNRAIGAKDAVWVKEIVVRHSIEDTTDELFRKPAAMLEFMGLVGSGGKQMTPWTDLTAKS